MGPAALVDPARADDSRASRRSEPTGHSSAAVVCDLALATNPSVPRNRAYLLSTSRVAA